jgi:hypothetical protein
VKVVLDPVPAGTAQTKAAADLLGSTEMGEIQAGSRNRIATIMAVVAGDRLGSDHRWIFFR